MQPKELSYYRALYVDFTERWPH